MPKGAIEGAGMPSPPKIAVLCRDFIFLQIAKMENYKEKLPNWLKNDAKSKKEELAHAIKSYKNAIEILESIKRTHKKDGSDFQNLWKNFDAPECVRLCWWYCVYTKYTTIHAYWDGEHHEIQLEGHDATAMQDATADEIEEEIKKWIEKYKGRLKDAENNYALFDGEVEQLAKITAKLGEFLDGLQSENDYKLRELLKKAL